MHNHHRPLARLSSSILVFSLARRTFSFSVEPSVAGGWRSGVMETHLHHILSSHAMLCRLQPLATQGPSEAKSAAFIALDVLIYLLIYHYLK